MMATTMVVDDDPSLDVVKTGVSVTAVVSALVAAVTSSAGAVSSSAGSTAGALVEVDASGMVVTVVDDVDGGVESLYLSLIHI